MGHILGSVVVVRLNLLELKVNKVVRVKRALLLLFLHGGGPTRTLEIHVGSETSCTC